MTRSGSSRAALGGSAFEERCRRLGPALMRDLSLTDFQAAGVLGNLGHETGGFRHLQELRPAVAGSRGGWGIAQWTGARRLAMERWCRAQGLDPASDEANEGYLRLELLGPEAAALEALRRSAALDQATEVFCRLFERPGVPALAARLAWAKRALRALRGSAEASPAASAALTASSRSPPPAAPSPHPAAPSPPPARSPR